jgi:beta-glucanase (GH16 family)
MKIHPTLLLIFFVTATSCSKNSSQGAPAVSPTNLTVKTVISTDSSGNVMFTASATNAVSYDFLFGDYESQTHVTGGILHKYPFSGTYTVTVTAKSAGGQTTTTSFKVTVTVALVMVWSDEFDVPGSPDPSKWGFDIGTGSGGWGNNELEYYTNRQANAIISNGTLKIIALNEYYNSSNYTSARMLTNNLFSFQYGRIDVRAKLPTTAGTWPAIWMLGNNLPTAGWPACGEIDIMEQNGSQKSTIYGTLHYPTEVNQYGDGSTTILADAGTAFHTYTSVWTPTKIELYVDSNMFYSLPNSPGLPFNQKFFIILNVAMGGNFGGTVDPAFTKDQLEVDYVRVYQ